MSTAICRIRLDVHGLSGRTRAVLDREAQRYEAAVEQLQGDDPDEHIDPADEEAEAAPLSADVLLDALGGPAADGRTTVAAFVAGRCTTDDQTVDATIRTAVDALVSSVDRSERLGPLAHTFVEAVMSLALLGEPDTAVELFTAQLSDPESRSVADSRAAGYLAQLGVATGYPVLLEDLHQSRSAMVRMRSLEDLLPFAAFVGVQVDGTVVDVAAELRLAAEDDPSVAGQAQRVAAMLGIDLGDVAIAT